MSGAFSPSDLFYFRNVDEATFAFYFFPYLSSSVGAHLCRALIGFPRWPLECTRTASLGPKLTRDSSSRQKILPWMVKFFPLSSDVVIGMNAGQYAYESLSVYTEEMVQDRGDFMFNTEVELIGRGRSVTINVLVSTRIKGESC